MDSHSAGAIRKAMRSSRHAIAMVARHIVGHMPMREQPMKRFLMHYVAMPFITIVFLMTGCEGDGDNENGDDGGTSQWPSGVALLLLLLLALAAGCATHRVTSDPAGAVILYCGPGGYYIDGVLPGPPFYDMSTIPSTGVEKYDDGRPRRWGVAATTPTVIMGHMGGFYRVAKEGYEVSEQSWVPFAGFRGGKEIHSHFVL